MGVGTPINLLENIARGVDMFDCIMPTRNGRNGQLFTSYGTINIAPIAYALTTLILMAFAYNMVYIRVEIRMKRTNTYLTSLALALCLGLPACKQENGNEPESLSLV